MLYANAVELDAQMIAADTKMSIKVINSLNLNSIEEHHYNLHD